VHNFWYVLKEVLWEIEDISRSKEYSICSLMLIFRAFVYIQSSSNNQTGWFLKRAIVKTSIPTKERFATLFQYFGETKIILNSTIDQCESKSSILRILEQKFFFSVPRRLFPTTFSAHSHSDLLFPQAISSFFINVLCFRTTKLVHPPCLDLEKNLPNFFSFFLPSHSIKRADWMYLKWNYLGNLSTYIRIYLWLWAFLLLNCWNKRRVKSKP
jgi:hypothetical protein